MRRTASRSTAALAAFSMAIAGLVLSASTDVASSAPISDGDISKDVASALSEPHVVDEVIVKFVPGSPASARASARLAAGAVAAEALSPLAEHSQVLQLGRGTTVGRALEALLRNPNVEYAEPNYLLESTATPNDPKFTDGTLWGMLGDASSPSNQYGSQAAEVWTAGHIGSEDVYVVVIDTGVQVTHPDLAANIWTNPFDPIDGVDNDGNGFVDDVHGWDFFYDDSSVYDGLDDDHGTHVAGTIGGVGGNGAGVVGVNWDVTMITAKFLGPNGGSTSTAVRAVDYATDLKNRHGLNIVATSNSWGGGGASTSLLDAIERGGDAGILFVAAAGNSNVDADSSPHYPSSYACDRTASGAARGWDCVISVASITSSGARSSFSNYGVTSVDLGAPGSSIHSTLPENTYGSYSGTSMATPHVSGAIALCASINQGQTAQDLLLATLANVAPTSSMVGRTVTGGRLDLSAMVGACVGATAPVEGSPSGLAATTVSTSSIDLTWTDGSTGESFQEIDVSTDGCSSFTKVATVGGDAESATVVGLDPSTDHCFRVRAGNGFQGGTYSAWSNTASARTFDPPPGYTCVSEPYSWVATTSGTSLSLGDDGSTSQAIGFSFGLYGQSASTAWVGSNGVVGLAGTVNQYQNVTIPNAGQPNGLIAAFWDDLNPGAGGTVRVLRDGAEGSRRFIASWEDVPHYSVANGVTFQAILEESTGDVVLQYQDVVFGSSGYDGGRSATVGIEDHAGEFGTLISYNTATLSNGTAYRCSLPSGVQITTTSLPAGTTGSAYSATLSASGGDGTNTWDVSGLPSGLSLTDDTISGTPDAAGTSTVTVSVLSGDGSSDSVDLELVVGAPVFVTTSSLDDGSTSAAYSATLAASGGTTPYTWSIVTGSLPAGLTLGGDTISGTPTTAGTSTFTVQVTDSIGRTDTAELSITTTQSLTSTASGEILGGGTVSGTFEATHAEDGVVQTIGERDSGGRRQNRYDWMDHTWIVPVAPGTNTLTIVARWNDAGDSDTGARFEWFDGSTWNPIGTVDSSSNSELSAIIGVPSVAEIRVRVRDNDQTPGNRSNDSVAVDFIGITGDGETPPPTIVTTGFPDATRNAEYTASVEVSGGTAPLAWSITSGSLPNGLSLDTTTGLISGSATSLGTSSFTIGVSDGDGRTDSASFSITVVDVPVATTMTTSLSTSTTGGRTKNGVATVTVTDELGNPVSGAEVTVQFTGSFNDLLTGTTGSDGTVTLTTLTAQRRPRFSACIMSVVSGALTWDGSNACNP